MPKFKKRGAKQCVSSLDIQPCCSNSVVKSSTQVKEKAGEDNSADKQLLKESEGKEKKKIGLKRKRIGKTKSAGSLDIQPFCSNSVVESSTQFKEKGEEDNDEAKQLLKESEENENKTFGLKRKSIGNTERASGLDIEPFCSNSVVKSCTQLKEKAGEDNGEDKQLLKESEEKEKKKIGLKRKRIGNTNSAGGLNIRPCYSRSVVESSTQFNEKAGEDNAEDKQFLKESDEKEKKTFGLKRKSIGNTKSAGGLNTQPFCTNSVVKSSTQLKGKAEENNGEDKQLLKESEGKEKITFGLKRKRIGNTKSAGGLDIQPCCSNSVVEGSTQFKGKAEEDNGEDKQILKESEGKEKKTFGLKRKSIGNTERASGLDIEPFCSNSVVKSCTQLKEKAEEDNGEDKQLLKESEEMEKKTFGHKRKRIGNTKSSGNLDMQPCCSSSVVKRSTQVKKKVEEDNGEYNKLLEKSIIENEKFTYLLSKLSDEQLSNLETYRTCSFAKNNIRKVMQEEFVKRITERAVAGASTVSKLFVAQIIDKALAIDGTKCVTQKKITEAVEIQSKKDILLISEKSSAAE
ncbi:transcription initiation factor TFIID subunit 11-like isoform X2 [Teleopsis dalmanni]|uniref:transcription initiation factor TFIID subunit 11-like isoform X2 n=1 Tax=Teleopsis dalmanni TaxID=139649 RepID=UPI0018CD5610|nr:transcription initiation factor TFIID subunit 11-like isoform X2 [Teleopsis dalmanni]